MATYVLVHGGGHGGWCYQPVARLLRSSGHEVYTPTLTTRGLGCLAYAETGSRSPLVRWRRSWWMRRRSLAAVPPHTPSLS